ncbi:MAG TPA: DbpA RNA binding domain-containing protein [Gemmatimonadales bacterium]
MDAVPVVARGHNVAVFLPPITEATLPLLQAATKRPLLIITPDADRAVALSSGLEGAFAVSGLTRAQRRLATTPDVLVVGVGDAYALLRRSALRPAEFHSIVIAWPEQMDEEGTSALEAIMAECDKEAQRVIITSESGSASERLVERYAFKAMTYGFPAGHSVSASVGGARYVVARPSQMADVRRRILDALDPEHDNSLIISPAPASRDAAAALVSSAGDTPPVIVAEAYQLPWLRSLFMPLSHLVLPTSADAADVRAEKLRSRIARVVETENLDRELMIVAPLFERFDPATVAAGLLRLVAGQGGQVSPSASRLPPPEATAPVPTFAKVWIGVGKKDNVKPGDLVGAIVNETRVPADALGKIEVRDLFCLVEVKSEQAEKVAQGLTGVNLRGRRLTARIDRGAGHKPPRRA